MKSLRTYLSESFRVTFDDVKVLIFSCFVRLRDYISSGFKLFFCLVHNLRTTNYRSTPWSDNFMYIFLLRINFRWSQRIPLPTTYSPFQTVLHATLYSAFGWVTGILPHLVNCSLHFMRKNVQSIVAVAAFGELGEQPNAFRRASLSVWLACMVCKQETTQLQLMC